KHLLKKFRADQPLKDKAAIGLRRVALQPLGSPAAAFGIINVHEFRANRPAVELPRRGSGLTIDDQFRMYDWRQEAERIKIRREISQTPVALKYAPVGGVFPHDRFRHLCVFLCVSFGQGSHSIKHAADVAYVRQPGEETTSTRARNDYVARLFRGEGLLANRRENPRV